jgi:type IV secretory pathway ATPase VirB11/archaellum biosynthesis ATPase
MQNLEGTGEIPMRRLVKEALRMRPDRLIVGEVREADTRSKHAATVGTTNAEEMFSPASSGSVQILLTASLPMRRLVKEALRMRPDRLIVGEVREAESLDMLIAVGTTNAEEMFSPASSGSVQILLTASLAEFACRLGRSRCATWSGCSAGRRTSRAPARSPCVGS